MANHGYISRNGVASVVELTTASNEGMCIKTWKSASIDEIQCSAWALSCLVSCLSTLALWPATSRPFPLAANQRAASWVVLPPRSVSLENHRAWVTRTTALSVTLPLPELICTRRK